MLFDQIKTQRVQRISFYKAHDMIRFDKYNYFYCCLLGLPLLSQFVIFPLKLRVRRRAGRHDSEHPAKFMRRADHALSLSPVVCACWCWLHRAPMYVHKGRAGVSRTPSPTHSVAPRRSEYSLEYKVCDPLVSYLSLRVQEIACL